jgi:hypothetical protein
VIRNASLNGRPTELLIHQHSHNDDLDLQGPMSRVAQCLSKMLHTTILSRHIPWLQSLYQHICHPPPHWPLQVCRMSLTGTPPAHYCWGCWWDAAIADFMIDTPSSTHPHNTNCPL